VQRRVPRPGERLYLQSLQKPNDFAQRNLAVISAKRGEDASSDIQDWANRIAGQVDGAVTVDVYYDGDSSTYVLRLVKGSRVLVFRLSEAQVRTSEREAECERTLRRKIKDLWNLI
jgi:hypothetical protein